VGEAARRATAECSSPSREGCRVATVMVRYRCSGCGNLTRFDVVSSRRTRAFHHFSVGGELEIEEEEILDARVEQVTCRWCGATGTSIEEIAVDTG